MPRKQFGDVSGEGREGRGDFRSDSRPFTARYDDWCEGDCGGPICAGEQVSYVDDELMHTDCIPTYTAQTRDTPICQNCYLQHRGECP